MLTAQVLAQAPELPEIATATGVTSLAWLLFVLPAAGALVLFLAGRRANAWGHWLGRPPRVASFVLGRAIFFPARGVPAAQRTSEVHLFDWMAVAGLSVDFGLRI